VEALSITAHCRVPLAQRSAFASPLRPAALQSLVSISDFYCTIVYRAKVVYSDIGIVETSFGTGRRSRAKATRKQSFPSLMVCEAWRKERSPPYQEPLRPLFSVRSQAGDTRYNACRGRGRMTFPIDAGPPLQWQNPHRGHGSFHSERIVVGSRPCVSTRQEDCRPHQRSFCPFPRIVWRVPRPHCRMHP
jgi:hypothetical protein